MRVLTVNFHKPKTYVLLVSEFFPKSHKRAGEPTEFIKKIKDGRKIHTIRANYELWKKRIEEVQAGNAVLSIRTWEGKPYRSKQIEHLVLDGSSGMGVQKIGFEEIYYMEPLKDLAKNDGLSQFDLEDWFENYDWTKKLAIIHFTEFRYELFSDSPLAKLIMSRIIPPSLVEEKNDEDNEGKTPPQPSLEGREEE